MKKIKEIIKKIEWKTNILIAVSTFIGYCLFDMVAIKKDGFRK